MKRIGGTMATDQEKEMMRKTAEFAIGLSDSLKRLESNEDFNKVFGFYFHNEPIRYTMELANPKNAEDISKCNAIKDKFIGIAQCYSFLQSIHAIADQQRNTLKDLEEDNAPATSVEAEVVE